MHKKLLIIFQIVLFLILVSCKKEIEINNKVSSIKIQSSDILSEKMQIIEYREIKRQTIVESCEMLGFCFKCGFTIGMKHECSLSMWRNCPGKHDVTYDSQDYLYFIQYHIKNKTNLIHSPRYIGTNKTIVSQTQCK